VTLHCCGRTGTPLEKMTPKAGASSVQKRKDAPLGHKQRLCVGQEQCNRSTGACVFRLDGNLWLKIQSLGGAITQGFSFRWIRALDISARS
jgi:hypothetical protein